MKGLIALPIILGTMLLIGGGAVVAVGLAHNKGDTKMVENEHELSESFTNINIDLQTANLEFVATTDGTAKVVCNEREKYPHDVEVKDGTLNIKFVDKVKWYEKIFNWNWKTETITVYMPVADYTNLKIETSTGSTKIKGDYTFENLDIKASTGAVYLESDVTEKVNIYLSTGAIHIKDMETKSMNLKASTGNMYLQKVNVDGKLYTKASTGDIILEDVTAKEYESKTSTGDLTLTDTIIDGHLQAECSTGHVKFNDSDAKTMYVKTDTGYIKGTLLTEHIFSYKTDTGHVSVPKGTTGGLCELITDTGDIVITIKK